MLAEKKQRCTYCQKTSYFYVFVEEKGNKAAILTQCPKCKKFSDCWYIPKSKVQIALVKVLQCKEPDLNKKKDK